MCHTSISLHASLLCCQDFALSTLPFFPLLSFEVPGLLPARPAARPVRRQLPAARRLLLAVRRSSLPCAVPLPPYRLPLLPRRWRTCTLAVRQVLEVLGVHRSVRARRCGDSGERGGGEQCKASASDVQRAAGGEQRAAGGGGCGAAGRAARGKMLGGDPSGREICSNPGFPVFRIYFGTNLYHKLFTTAHLQSTKSCDTVSPPHLLC